MAYIISPNILGSHVPVHLANLGSWGAPQVDAACNVVDIKQRWNYLLLGIMWLKLIAVCIQLWLLYHFYTREYIKYICKLHCMDRVNSSSFFYCFAKAIRKNIFWIKGLVQLCLSSEGINTNTSIVIQEICSIFGCTLAIKVLQNFFMMFHYRIVLSSLCVHSASIIKNIRNNKVTTISKKTIVS